jgi:hypothetical protein
VARSAAFNVSGVGSVARLNAFSNISASAAVSLPAASISKICMRSSFIVFTYLTDNVVGFYGHRNLK